MTMTARTTSKSDANWSRAESSKRNCQWIREAIMRHQMWDVILATEILDAEMFYGSAGTAISISTYAEVAENPCHMSKATSAHNAKGCDQCNSE